jgi:hypothetical protein
MRIVVITNKKGSVGNASTLIHLAYSLAEKGLKVVVIDFDRQANASFTIGKYDCGITASSLFTDASVPALDATDGISLSPSDPGLANLDKFELATWHRHCARGSSQWRRKASIFVLSTRHRVSMSQCFRHCSQGTLWPRQSNSRLTACRTSRRWSPRSSTPGAPIQSFCSSG